MLHSFSFGELALIFGIILILFGGSRLATIGKSLGEGISNFKKGLNSANEEATPKATTAHVHESAGKPNQVYIENKPAPQIVDVHHREKENT